MDFLPYYNIIIIFCVFVGCVLVLLPLFSYEEKMVKRRIIIIDYSLLTYTYTHDDKSSRIYKMNIIIRGKS